MPVWYLRKKEKRITHLGCIIRRGLYCSQWRLRSACIRVLSATESRSDKIDVMGAQGNLCLHCPHVIWSFSLAWLIWFSIYPKYSDTSTPYHICSKIWTSTIHYPMLCLKIAGWVANSVNPDETLRSASSHLGLYCLLKPVCLNTYGSSW